MKISDQLQRDNDSGALAYHWDAWNCNDNGKRLGQQRSLPLPSCIVFPQEVKGVTLSCCLYFVVFIILANAYILFQDGAVGRVLT